MTAERNLLTVLLPQKERPEYTLRQQNSPNSISKAAIKSDDILSRMFAEKWTVDINSLAEAVAERAAAVSDHSHDEAVCAVMTALKNHYADRLYKISRDVIQRSSHRNTEFLTLPIQPVWISQAWMTWVMGSDSFSIS